MLLHASPGIAGDKEFRKSVRQSEKALGVEVSLVPTDPFYRSTPFMLTAAAVMVIAAVASVNIFIQTHRIVHVVNGLKVPIAVSGDGAAPGEVAPHGELPLSVAEGTHKATVARPAGFTEPVDFALQAGWFERFFKSPVWIIDPTRSAAVVWESTVYRDRAAQGPAGFDAGSLQWHIGQPFTTYADVDYPFQEFPAELRVKNQREATKTRVTIADLKPYEAMNATAMQPGRQTDLLAFAESHLRVDPADSILLMIYSAMAAQAQQQNRCREFLATRLDERPVLIDWHRVYQEQCQAREHDGELFGRYDRYLAAEPDNSALLYLRGRIDEDDAKAAGYYERSRQADPKNPYPWYAQGYRLRVGGDFAGARAALEEAVRLRPDDPLMSQ